MSLLNAIKTNINLQKKKIICIVAWSKISKSIFFNKKNSIYRHLEEKLLKSLLFFYPKNGM